MVCFFSNTNPPEETFNTFSGPSEELKGTRMLRSRCARFVTARYQRSDPSWKDSVWTAVVESPGPRHSCCSRHMMSQTPLHIQLPAEGEDLAAHWEYVNEGGMNMIFRYTGDKKDGADVSWVQRGNDVRAVFLRTSSTSLAQNSA